MPNNDEESIKATKTKAVCLLLIIGFG